MRPGAQPANAGAGYWPRATPFRAQLPPLAETLEAEFNIAQMRALARLWDIQLKGSSRNGFVAQVAEALAARVAQMRTNPEALLEGLPPDQAELARRLLTARDHELPLPRTLAASLWSRQVADSPDRSLTEALDALRRRALIFPTHRYTGYRDVYYQWLPLTASGGNVPVISWPVQRSASPDRTRPAGHTGAARFLDAFDLVLQAMISTGVSIRPPLAGHAQAGQISWLRRWEHDPQEAQRLLNSRPGWVPNPNSGISVPATSWLSPEAAITLENQTGLPAAECEFLFTIAAGLQLIEAPDFSAETANDDTRPSQAGRYVRARMSAVEAWYALSNEQRFLRAWTAWQETVPDAIEVILAAHSKSALHTPTSSAAHSDLPKQPLFKVMRAIGAREMGPLDLGAEWCALRRYLFRILRGLPRQQWVDWPTLRRALFDFHPDCAWTFMTPEHWWFANPDGLTRLQHRWYDDWVHSIGAVLEAALRGPLYWLGLVEIEEKPANATSEADKAGIALAAFRVTDMVDWVIQAQIVVSTSSEGPAAHTVPTLPATATPRPRAVAPVTWLDSATWRLPPAPNRAEFIAFARKIGEPTDTPFTYRLTPASIQSALREGITTEEVAAQFERFGAPAPEAALRQYRAIAERYGRVRLYESLTVLQLSDDYALPELLANTSLAQAIVYQISPRAVVIRADMLDELVREFVERGYTPAVT